MEPSSNPPQNTKPTDRVASTESTSNQSVSKCQSNGATIQENVRPDAQPITVKELETLGTSDIDIKTLNRNEADPSGLAQNDGHNPTSVNADPKDNDNNADIELQAAKSSLPNAEGADRIVEDLSHETINTEVDSPDSSPKAIVCQEGREADGSINVKSSENECSFKNSKEVNDTGDEDRRDTVDRRLHEGKGHEHIGMVDNVVPEERDVSSPGSEGSATQLNTSSTDSGKVPEEAESPTPCENTKEAGPKTDDNTLSNPSNHTNNSASELVNGQQRNPPRQDNTETEHDDDTDIVFPGEAVSAKTVKTPEEAKMILEDESVRSTGATEMKQFKNNGTRVCEFNSSSLTDGHDGKSRAEKRTDTGPDDLNITDEERNGRRNSCLKKHEREAGNEKVENMQQVNNLDAETFNKTSERGEDCSTHERPAEMTEKADGKCSMENPVSPGLDTASDQKRTDALSRIRSAQTHDKHDDQSDYSYDTLRRMAEKHFVYFWHRTDLYSQWFESEFFVDRRRFTSAEQYMMFKKAELFGDCEMMLKIEKTSDPRKIKRYGRQVWGFNEETWQAARLAYVKEGNIAKFSQNDIYKEMLFDTHPRVLVEASPYDEIWGIGCSMDDPDAFDESTWRGLNLLGFIITEVRLDLMVHEEKLSIQDRTKFIEELKRKYRFYPTLPSYSEDEINKLKCQDNEQKADKIPTKGATATTGGDTSPNTGALSRDKNGNENTNNLYSPYKDGKVILGSNENKAQDGAGGGWNSDDRSGELYTNALKSMENTGQGEHISKDGKTEGGEPANTEMPGKSMGKEGPVNNTMESMDLKQNPALNKPATDAQNVAKSPDQDEQTKLNCDDSTNETSTSPQIKLDSSLTATNIPDTLDNQAQTHDGNQVTYMKHGDNIIKCEAKNMDIVVPKQDSPATPEQSNTTDQFNRAVTIAEPSNIEVTHTTTTTDSDQNRKTSQDSAAPNRLEEGSIDTPERQTEVPSEPDKPPERIDILIDGFSNVLTTK